MHLMVANLKIVLIAPNASLNMGGEALKAFQYFQYLLLENYDAYLCTHARCADELGTVFPNERLLVVEEDRFDQFLWRSRVGKPLLTQYFFRRAKRKILDFGFHDAIWHYVSPISPVEPRPIPTGIPVVIGPLNGNIYYPPGFRHRRGARAKCAERLHQPMQRFLSFLIGDKKRAALILNSGYQRTLKSLSWAGADAAKTIDVVDSGLPEYIATVKPVEHSGRNGKFFSLGRLVELKGQDMAIRALVRCPDDITLTIYGKGEEQGPLEQLAADLGIADRVNFAGWMNHDDIATVAAQFRGFLFPTLADANGIVMQEMMMLGVPVVTLNWGGPAQLGTDDSVSYIEPVDHDHVVAGLADAMIRLAEDDVSASRMAQKARAIAEEKFLWKHVGKSWAATYDRLT